MFKSDIGAKSQSYIDNNSWNVLFAGLYWKSI